MPKQSIEISDFSGGLDAISDPRDIKDNQFSKNWNVIVDRNGVLRLAGRGQHEIPASMFSNEKFQEGFGLFQFSVDYSINEFNFDAINGIETGTIDAFTSTSSFTLENTASLPALHSDSNDYYKDMTIFIYSGTGVGESRLITGYTGTSRAIACTAFDALDTNSKYIIFPWQATGSVLGTAALKDYVTNGTIPDDYSASSPPIDPYDNYGSYYFLSNIFAVSNETSSSIGDLIYKKDLELIAGTEYNLEIIAAFKNNWKNYVCNGHEDGNETNNYGDKPTWIELYSTSVTDGTSTGLSLYADGQWVSISEQADYASLTESNFIDNGDFTNGLADGWHSSDLTSVITHTEEGASEAYGTHDGTLTLTSTADLDYINGRPESYIYQQMSLDDNTPYHLNFVYSADAASGGLKYSIVDVKNLVSTGVVTNLGSTISDTGDGLTSGDSLAVAVDTVDATSNNLLNKNIYLSTGVFVGICTAVGSTTAITLGGGVAVDLDNNEVLYIENVLLDWTRAEDTGGLTTYKFLNEVSNVNNNTITSYAKFNVPDSSGGKCNVQLRFAPSSASKNVNIAGVTVHKAFNDLTTMSKGPNGENPFLGSTKSWSKYNTKFKVPIEYEHSGNKSDWVFKVHFGKYGFRENATNSSNSQSVYLAKVNLTSQQGDTITALNDNTYTKSCIGLFSDNTKSWDKSTLVWESPSSKPVYDYINGSLKLSDANFDNSNSNMLLYYNNRNNNFISENKWEVKRNPINTPPQTIVTNITTNPYLSTEFDACAYLNILHAGDHWYDGYDTVTNWNQDEFGIPDGTGAPFGNGHIIKYLSASDMPISLLKTKNFGRYLPDPNNTDNHSTSSGVEPLSTKRADHDNLKQQNPLCARIVGLDTVNTSEGMSQKITADKIAKVKYSILWEISCDAAFHDGGHYFNTIGGVPYFELELFYSDPARFTVNSTSGTSPRTHQEAVSMNDTSLAHGYRIAHKTHGKAAADDNVKIGSVHSGDAVWDDVEIVSYNHNTDGNHSEVTVLIKGELNIPENIAITNDSGSTQLGVLDTDDLVFKIKQMATLNDFDSYAPWGSPLTDISLYAYTINTVNLAAGTCTFHSDRHHAVFSRFMVQNLDVVFYNPAFSLNTDLAVLNGDMVGLNIVWNSPTGSSSSSWSERSFKVGTTSVNYFNEESAIMESSQTITPVSPGYAPEVCVQMKSESLQDIYTRKTKFYFKDNESDIWYLQFYVDHDTRMFHSTTSGYKTAMGTVDDVNFIAVILRENLKDFNEVNSYESETMVSQEDATSNGKLTARYKTSVVANNRLYVGNIMQNGEVMGDRLIKSPIGKYNLLPASNFIDVATNDGDEITALSFYKDKLLQFKKRKVFVINTSDDYEFLEDTFQDIGVKGQCSVVTTPNGVAWANKTGCYLYDGEKLTNLIEGIIPNSNNYASETNNTWNPGESATNNSKYVIGYIEDRDSILVNFSDKALTTLIHPLAAIYHFGTKSWTPLYTSLSKQSDGATGNFSNFITDNNGDILYYHHDSTKIAEHINEIKKWNHDAIQDSDFSITTKNFVFQTKDITFDSISSTKNIYTVYITYKVKRDGTDSGVVVKAAVNGSGDFSSSPILFSNSTSKFQGTTTNCYVGDTLDETDGIWKTAKLKFDNPSLVKGINSIQLHLSGAAAFDFEINDISITYRIIKKN